MSRPNWRSGKVGASTPAQQPQQQQRGPALNLSNGLTAPITANFSIVPTNRGSAQNSEDGFSTNPHESTACVFFEVCAEFAHACAEVWPSDSIIAAESERLFNLGKNFTSKQEEGLRLAKAFHAAFVNHYPLVVSKDGKFFSLPNEILISASAANKYASSPKDVRETIWEYMRSLVQYAGMVDMYSKCPQAMLDSISGVAGGLIAKLQNGELDASTLNPLQLGQMMMQEMSTADLEGFGNAILEGGNMDSMMSIMQSTMSGMGGTPGGMGGMPDLSMLSEMFGKK